MFSYEGVAWGHGGRSRSGTLSLDIQELGQSQLVPWKQGGKGARFGSDETRVFCPQAWKSALP